MKKKSGMIHQLPSVATNSVQQNDDTFSRLPGKKPAMHRCATGTLKLNYLNRQIGRWHSDFAITRRNQNAALMPGKDCKSKRSHRKDSGNDFQFSFQAQPS